MWYHMEERRVWRYQRGNQNPYIVEEQTTQWPKEKVQKDKQRSTKHTHKTKDRATRTPLKTGGEIRCSERVSSSCSTSDTCCVNLVTNPVTSHEWGKDRKHLIMFKGKHCDKGRYQYQISYDKGRYQYQTSYDIVTRADINIRHHKKGDFTFTLITFDVSWYKDV